MNAKIWLFANKRLELKKGKQKTRATVAILEIAHRLSRI